ncbi:MULTISPECIES: DUF3908 family protein [Heyndrickxia]|uniref:DUF3908 family protein n=1 Tax=Heyndrickxia TaxID=2837504 RepID=UPI002DB56D78|nr:DUF3908 family protein [Weizmannia sp. CD-2023]MEC2222865.1 DUF3908 family protein [Weizmannia sp. CD-2023]
MDFITFEKFRKFVYQKSYSSPHYGKIEGIIEDLQESGLLKKVIENDHFFYPKYLWQEDKNLELFFFTSDNLIKCSYDEETTFCIEIRKLIDIDLIETKVTDFRRRDAELKIRFRDGVEYLFTSNDSNDQWKYKYFNTIKEIQELLS